MKQVDDIFDDYILTTDIQETYATKDEVKQVDERFDDYTTTNELESTYLKKDDLPSTDFQFIAVDGFPYFTVKNEHITINNNHSYNGNTFQVLMINIPDDIKQQIYERAQH